MDWFRQWFPDLLDPNPGTGGNDEECEDHFNFEAASASMLELDRAMAPLRLLTVKHLTPAQRDYAAMLAKAAHLTPAQRDYAAMLAKAAMRLHEWLQRKGIWLEQGEARLTPELRENHHFPDYGPVHSDQQDWLHEFWHPFVLLSLSMEVSDDDYEAAIFSMICVIYLFLHLVTVTWGGDKTYNPGTTEFTVTYVSLLLIKGSYVWIKFRDVSPRNSDHKGRVGYVYTRTRSNASGTKYPTYEPRYIPAGQTNRLSLGEYAAEHDAQVVLQYAKFQDDEKADEVYLGEGFLYFKSKEGNFSAEEKWARIQKNAKNVLTEYHAWRARDALAIMVDEILNELPDTLDDKLIFDSLQ